MGEGKERMVFGGDGSGLASLLKEYGDTHGLTTEQVITEIEDEIQERVAEDTREYSPLTEIELYLSQAYSSLEEALDNLEEAARLRPTVPNELDGIQVVVPEEILPLLERVRAEIEVCS